MYREEQCHLQTAPDVRHAAQEDLCLMTTDAEGVLRFVSGAVLFPQRWSLLEKLGMDMRRARPPLPAPHAMRWPCLVLRCLDDQPVRVAEYSSLAAPGVAQLIVLSSCA